jgi:hypothetical protein
MKFVPVEALPPRDFRRKDSVKHKDLYTMLDDFDKSQHEIVHVEVDVRSEYSNLNSCVCTFRDAIAKYAYRMKVVVRQGAVYLVKTKKIDTMSIDPFAFDTNEEAASFIHTLARIAETYSFATSADAYDLFGVNAGYLHHKYGWSFDQLKNIKPTKANYGYTIVLPPAICIEAGDQ